MRLTTAASAIAISTALLAHTAAAQAEQMRFEIAAKPVSEALQDFAEQSGFQMAFLADAATGVPARPVSGALEPEAALRRLLEGTGLEFRFIDERTIAILQKTAEAESEGQAEQGTMRYASAADQSRSSAPIRQIAQAQTQTAQQQQSQAEDDGLQLEEIVVTGSRIARAGYDTLQPAVNLSSEFIDDRGFQNVGDAISEIPAFGIGTSKNGRQGGLTGGQTFVNAFGLGTQRTLTLINGRRVVPQNSPGVVDNAGAGPGAGAGLQVDMNIIPTAMVERIETVFIGGAPIYGTDAVAGTVNIILKDDFEGFSAEGQWGIDQRGDTQNGRVRGAWGANTADGRGNVILAAEYSTTTALNSEENSVARRQTAFCENPEAGINAAGLPNVDPADGIPDLVLCDDAVNILGLSQIITLDDV